MKTSADKDPVLYLSMLAGSSGITSPADQDLILSNIMLTRFFWNKVADQGPVLYNIMLTRLFCY